MKYNLTEVLERVAAEIALIEVALANEYGVPLSNGPRLQLQKGKSEYEMQAPVDCWAFALLANGKHVFWQHLDGRALAGDTVRIRFEKDDWYGILDIFAEGDEA